MTYLMPQPYKCIKCEYEFTFSPHNQHPAPTTYEQDPVCPKCWHEFIVGIGIGYGTTSWTKDGSAYEQKLKEKNT
jgi:DNA-directed RNA polymerase subunit RPC12/RpoP